MRILVITDRFWPEVTAVSVRTMDHARTWLECGHQVSVVTCVPNFPRGKPFAGYKNGLYQEEWVDGIHIIRVGSYMVPNEGVFRRTLDYVSFALTAVVLCHKYPQFDVILATSPPIFTALAGYLISHLRKRPWVFEIRDLWPASITAVGASKSRALRIVERFELFLYSKATRVISLTHSFKRNLISRGIPASKSDVITNGVDLARFDRSRTVMNARVQLGIAPDVFLAGYIGTVGMAHGLRTVIDAATECQHSSKIIFLIMGEGADRKVLENEATRRHLPNLIFKDFVPHEQIQAYLVALDVAIVHLKKDPVFKTVIPSKIFEYMAMGIPMIMAVEGESAEIVATAGSGVCIASDDPRSMAEAIMNLSANRTELEKMRNAGVNSVRKRYDRKVLAVAALNSFETAIRKYRQGSESRDTVPRPIAASDEACPGVEHSSEERHTLV